jgi:sec-independent protein translocase protein TatA
MFKSIGPMEIILILIIIFIFFGVGKLPQVGDAMGKAIRNFKKSQQADVDEEETAPPVRTSARKTTGTKKTATKKA